MLENQIRGLAVVFGVRLPRALSPAFIKQALQASRGNRRPVCGHARPHRGANCRAFGCLGNRYRHEEDGQGFQRCRRLMTIPGVGKLTALAFAAAVDDAERFRRSRDIGAYLGLCRVATSRARWTTPAASQSAATGECDRCSMKRRTSCSTRYKGPLKLKDWALAHRGAVDDAKGADRTCPAARHHHACDAAVRHHLQTRVAINSEPVRRPKTSSRAGATPEGGSGRRRRFCSMRSIISADCDFNQAAPYPANPIKCP